MSATKDNRTEPVVQMCRPLETRNFYHECKQALTGLVSALFVFILGFQRDKSLWRGRSPILNPSKTPIYLILNFNHRSTVRFRNVCHRLNRDPFCFGRLFGVC